MGTDVAIALGVLGAVFCITGLSILVYLVKKKCCKQDVISDSDLDGVDGAWFGNIGIRHGSVVTDLSMSKSTERPFIFTRSIHFNGSQLDRTSGVDVHRGMFVSKTIDQSGGSIEFYGVMLKVPPGALLDHRKICLGVFWTCNQHPKLLKNETVLTPIVSCQPHGLQLQKSAILSLPHCAVDLTSDWTVTAWCSETTLTAEPDWKKFYQTQINIFHRCITLSLDHFTLYCASGQSNNPEAKKWIDLVAFAPPLGGKQFPVRVYCLDDYTDDEAKDVRKMAKSEEKQKGREVTSPVALAFHNDGNNLCVEMDKMCQPWLLSDVVNKIQELDFEQIWHGVGPSCKFVLTSAENVTRVECSISGFQKNHEDKIQKLVVAEEVQVNQDSSVDPEPENSVFPVHISDRIIKMLDPDVITENNWVALAEYMHMPLLDIHWLVDNHKKSGGSPTNYLLNKWAQQGKTLNEFKKAMTEIERYDVLTELD